jgi:hypothetical protein
MQCREFRGVLIKSDDASPNELPMHGSEDVAFASTSIDQQVARRLRDDGFPSWDRLRDMGRQYGTLFEYYRRNAYIDCDTHIYPPDPSVHNAEEGALEKAQQWIERRSQVEFSYDAAKADDVVEPISERHSTPPPLDELIPAPLLTADGYERFLHEWQRRNGERFIIGHRPSADDVGKGPVVVWTCASKRYKTEERKTRQTATARHRIDDSITEQERATARRGANTRRRHDVRVYYARTLCSRRRVAAVSLLGFGLDVDRQVIVACCMCTGFTLMSASHWHDGIMVCTRCHLRTRKGDSFDPAAMGVGASVKCRKCRAPRRASEQYASLSVYDDVNERFVLIHLCPRHAKKKTWLSASPNFHSLATVDAGISNSWLSLRRWQPEKDYLREEEEESMAKYVKAAAKEAEMNDDDNDDDDDDDGNETDASESSDDTAVPKTARRRVGVDSSRRRRQALLTAV